MATKTPEDMAEEYANSLWESPKYYQPEWTESKSGFLAGYQAAKDQLADGDKAMCSTTMEEIKAVDTGELMPITNLPPSAKWISVKERLPEPNALVVILHDDEMGLNHRKPPVYFGRHNGQYWLEALDHSDVMWDGSCKITHWMLLPEAPKDKL